MLFIYRFLILVGLIMCVVFMWGLSFHGVVVVSVLHNGGWLCCGFCASYVCGV